LAEVKMEESWRRELADVFAAPDFDKLTEFVRSEYRSEQILPAASNIFRAFDLCPFDDVKVVILGQDPYPTPGHAHGLCFSVEPHVRPFPKSLQNIFTEINRDLSLPQPANGNLDRWARQGVFLLNAILTVRAGAPASHRNMGWEWFTDRVIDKLNQRSKPIVFMLWGNFAQSKSALIDPEKHAVLTAPHPSPLSAHRGFIGCGHFSEANRILAARGRGEVVW
jgi:uracil-DNA glycosylase